ncbi:hypothetical protein M758_2G011000 [Ceratodon purpureus]|nr:hypothetical protein M758_2G011000 [Ceratodon purpureus]
MPSGIETESEKEETRRDETRRDETGRSLPSLRTSRLATIANSATPCSPPRNLHVFLGGGEGAGGGERGEGAEDREGRVCRAVVRILVHFLVNILVSFLLLWW